MAAPAMSERMQWLVIPRKLTVKVDLVSIFSSFVKKEYGKTAGERIDDAVKTLQQMRIDSCEYALKDDPTENTVKVLSTYYSQVLPISYNFVAFFTPRINYLQLIYIEKRWADSTTKVSDNCC